MKVAKRLLSVILVVVLCFSLLAGCKPQEEEKYTITFEADGKEVTKIEVKKGEKVIYPNVPSKEGYTGVWNPSSINSATQDTTVKAEYTKIVVTSLKIDKAGEYNVASEIKTVNVAVGGVTLNGGNLDTLVIEKSVGDGDVTINNVSAKTLNVYGGGENTIHVKGSSNMGKINIKREDGKVRVLTDDSAKVELVVVDDGCDDVILTGEFGEVVVESQENIISFVETTIENIKINVENAKVDIDANTKVDKIDLTEKSGKSTLNIKGEIAQLVSQAKDTVIDVKGKIAEVVIDSTASDNKIVMSGKTAVIDTMTTSAPNTNVSGNGKVEKVVANKGSDGSKFDANIDKIEIDKEVKDIEKPQPEVNKTYINIFSQREFDEIINNLEGITKLNIFCTINLTKDTTIPSEVKLTISERGMLNDNGYKLTINGEYHNNGIISETVKNEADFNNRYGNRIVLGNDINLTNVLTIDESVVIDLNGHVINVDSRQVHGIICTGNIDVIIEDNSTDADGKILCKETENFGTVGTVIYVYNGANVTLNSGSIEFDVAQENAEDTGCVAIRVVGGTDDNAVASTFTMNGGNVICDSWWGIFVSYNGAVVTINDGLVQANQNLPTGTIAISGNGSAGEGGTTININGGTIDGGESDGSLAIYHPQAGTLNINGGTMTGWDGVQMKSGTLNMTGGTIIASGDYIQPPIGNGNGSSSTGTALSVLSHEGYAGDIVINVTGGTLTSEKTFAIAEWITKGTTCEVESFSVNGATLTSGTNIATFYVHSATLIVPTDSIWTIERP